YVAEGLLRAEGFTEVQYVEVPAEGAGAPGALGAGQADLGMNFAGPFILRVDAGEPLVLLAGVHVGCFELFGTDQVRSIRDLKGKTVAAGDLNTAPVFFAILGMYVGVDPRTDLNLVLASPNEGMQLLADGKIDAYLAFPPGVQEFRAKHIGHSVVVSALDRPW